MLWSYGKRRIFYFQIECLIKYRAVLNLGFYKPKVKEEDLQKMVYLKAVVLEGLRRHPPGHFVLPHSVSADFDLNGYVVYTCANIFN